MSSGRKVKGQKLRPTEASNRHQLMQKVDTVEKNICSGDVDSGFYQWLRDFPDTAVQHSWLSLQRHVRS